LLTGGGDLAALGGDGEERDQVEALLLDWAEETASPVFGVCRGMQVLLHRYGSKLERVEGHVNTKHVVSFDSYRRSVNSFHAYAVLEVAPPLIPWARCAEDGLVEAVRHNNLPFAGVMWHPERVQPFADADIDLVRAWLNPSENLP